MYSKLDLSRFSFDFVVNLVIRTKLEIENTTYLLEIQVDMMSKRKGIRLQVLISVLILFVIISTVTIDWLISMHSYKKTMSENQLNNNYNYVQKLQRTAMHQLNYIQRNITAIANLSGSHTLTQADFDDWFETNDRHFSSIFMVDPDENILLMSPNQTNPESVIAPSEEKVLSFREPIKEVVHKRNLLYLNLILMKTRS